MAVSLLDSALWAQLYADVELAAILDDRAEIASLIEVERALARAEGQCGVIPPDAAGEIDRGLAGAVVTPEDLAQGVGAAGLPVPALVALLRRRLPGDAAHWLHWGVTSQDIVDTAHMLRLARAVDVIDARLVAVHSALATAARRHARTPMAGRTRSQISTPISLGVRIAAWARSIAEQRRALPAVRARGLCVLLAGSSGTNAVIAPHGQAVIAALAGELGLAPAVPWGASRAGLVGLGGWFAETSGVAGKIAGDLILMGRSDIDEVRVGQGGGSSTMPQKQNPVAAEATLALARYAGGLAAALHGTLFAAEERDAGTWAIEWLVMPQLAMATGVVLRHAEALAASIVADEGRLSTTLDRTHGHAMAEKAAFALAGVLPREEAQALVKRAVAEAARDGEHLRTALERVAEPPPGGWDGVFSLDADLDAAERMVEDLLAG